MPTPLLLVACVELALETTGAAKRRLPRILALQLDEMRHINSPTTYQERMFKPNKNIEEAKTR